MLDEIVAKKTGEEFNKSSSAYLKSFDQEETFENSSYGG
jgi:hypothetical protein